jgi:hypothetical protein
MPFWQTKRHTSQHLVAARAVVRVQQHDLVGFFPDDLGGVTKPEHVFRVLALAWITHAALADHERLEASLRRPRSTSMVGM